MRLLVLQAAKPSQNRKQQSPLHKKEGENIFCGRWFCKQSLPPHNRKQQSPPIWKNGKA